MRSNRLWGSVATAGLTAIAASLLVPLPAAHAEAKKVITGSDCADITVIGMRGSGHQDIYGSERTNYNENDEEVKRVEDIEYGVFSYAAEALRAEAPNGKTIKFKQVDYEPVDEFIGMGGTIHARPDEYAKAINDGSQKFLEAVNSEASTCTNTSIAVFGYGQGAGAIRVALGKLDQGLFSKVKAGWFIGDPIHDGSGKDGFEYYDAGTGWDRNVNGFTRMSQYWFKQDEEAEKVDKYAVLKEEDYVDVTAKDIPAPIPHTIPASFSSRIISMCEGGDAMCSPSDTNNVMDNKAKAYFEKDFLSHGAEWVFKTLSKPVTNTAKPAESATPSPQPTNSDNDLVKGKRYTKNQIMHDEGRGATWVAENPNDPYEFSNKCISDFAIIAARGSGEDGNGAGQPGHDEEGVPSIPGYSNIIATAAWGIKLRLPKETSVQFIPIDYPAHAVPFVGTHPTNAKEGAADVAAFFDSALDGGDLAAATFRKMIQECPDTKILVMGYSQGAWAVHLSLDKLSSEERERISGVYLIADPLRDSNDDGAEYFDVHSPEGDEGDYESYRYEDVQEGWNKNSGLGVAHAGGEIAKTLEKINPVDPRVKALKEFTNSDLMKRPIPSELKGDVLQVCSIGDGVCNFLMHYEGGYKPYAVNSGLPIVTPSLLHSLVLGKVDQTAKEASALAFTKTAVHGFSTVHPSTYNQHLEFQAYPPAWGANKLNAAYFDSINLPVKEEKSGWEEFKDSFFATSPILPPMIPLG